MRIFAFSILFGWFTPIFLSSKNPVMKVKSVNFYFKKTFDSFKKLSSVIKIGMLLTTTYLHPSMSQPGFHQVFWWSEWHPSFHCPEISRKIRLLSTSNHMFQMSSLINEHWQEIIMTNQFTTVPVQVNYACHSIYFTSINYEIWQVTTVTIDIWHPYNLVSPGKNH